MKLFLGDQGSQWWDADVEPFTGDLRLKLFASTRARLDEVSEAAKHNPKYRRHSVIVNGKKITRDPDQASAWVEEFLKIHIDDFEGVDDENGSPAEVTDENKVKIGMASVTLLNAITAKCAFMAGTKVEDEEKN